MCLFGCSEACSITIIYLALRGGSGLKKTAVYLSVRVEPEGREPNSNRECVSPRRGAGAES